MIEPPIRPSAAIDHAQRRRADTRSSTPPWQPRRSGTGTAELLMARLGSVACRLAGKSTLTLSPARNDRPVELISLVLRQDVARRCRGSGAGPQKIFGRQAPKACCGNNDHDRNPQCGFHGQSPFGSFSLIIGRPRGNLAGFRARTGRPCHIRQRMPIDGSRTPRTTKIFKILAKFDARQGGAKSIREFRPRNFPSAWPTAAHQRRS
jgi:hypothetical protein